MTGAAHHDEKPDREDCVPVTPKSILTAPMSVGVPECPGTPGDVLARHDKDIDMTIPTRSATCTVRIATSRLLATAAAAATLTAFGTVTATAAPAPTCTPVMVLGIPGSSEGAAHHPGTTQPKELYGATVAEALAGARAGSEHPVTAEAVNYPAVLSLNFTDGKYFASKDTGYAHTYNTLRSWSRACPSSRFALIGYSQGAHIAGDLAQTILHEHAPIGPDRLAGALLLADPGFVGYGARTQALRYEEKTSTFTPVDSGRAGPAPRADFDKTDPIYSICFVGDIVCAPGKSVDLHGRYATATYKPTGKSVAYTYGQLMATEERW